MTVRVKCGFCPPQAQTQAVDRLQQPPHLPFLSLISRSSRRVPYYSISPSCPRGSTSSTAGLVPVGPDHPTRDRIASDTSDSGTVSLRTALT
ncbi:hypothetical protein VTN02DRAFT_5049 [Thermoascus thermophilus]